VALASAAPHVVAAARGNNAEGTVEAITAAGVGHGRERGRHRRRLRRGDADRRAAAQRALDILVNNAGIARDQLMLRMKRADWDDVLATNLTGRVHHRAGGAQADDPAARRRIISIGSVVGQMGNAGQANYAASKAGLVGFSKAIAREVASGRSRSMWWPRARRTDMTQALTDKAQGDWSAQIPLGRIGTAEDVAAAVCFLASDEASYITGQVLAVNGGMYT
jgi:3-oxoacyl-[acyl-carrier protein] reductase